MAATVAAPIVDPALAERLDGYVERAAVPSAHAILDDLVVAPSGAGAVAWSTADPFGTPLPGFVATAPSGGPFGDPQQLPGAGVAFNVRRAS